MKQTLRNILPKNRFARSVSVLAGGTAAGQAISVLASPLLTRLYSPDDFGLLAVYASLLATIGVISSMSYQLAIPLPEKDQDSAHIVVLSLLIVLGISLAVLVAVFFFRYQIAHLLNTPSMSKYLWLLPPGLLLLGTYQVFNYWALRVKAFSAIARTKLTQSISAVIVKIAGYSIGPVSLIIGQISGQAAGTSSLGALAMRKRWHLFRSVRLKDIIWTAKRYRRFPLFSTWAAALNSAGTQLPPLLFASLFSPAAAGLYMLAHRVLSMPMTLIGRSIGDVFFSTGAEAHRNRNLGELVSKLHTKLSQIAMPPILFLFIIGPEIFTLVFGENWRMAGEAARWLSPMLYVQFIVSPLSRILTIMERQSLGLVLQAILFAVRVIAIVLAWKLSGNFVFAVLLYGALSSIGYLLYLFVITSLSGAKVITFLNPTFKMIPVALFAVLPVLMATMYQSNLFFYISVSISVFLMSSFYIYLFVHKSNYLNKT